MRTRLGPRNGDETTEREYRLRVLRVAKCYSRNGDGDGVGDGDGDGDGD